MNRLRRRFAAVLVFWTSVLPLHAQVTRDFAVDLQADVSATVPHVTLSWSLRQNANITAQVIYRRLKGETIWGSPLATLTVTDTSWADATALPGVEYEYWMRRSYTSISPNVALGYITAGYNLPMVENRGKLLLVVDDTMTSPLAFELEQLRADLVSDGWTVQTIVAARRDSHTDATAVSDTKALIKAAYDADPTNVKQVYIVGHVPVPYSGVQAPDGHGNHIGAWPADGFYGDMDGTWTDTTSNNTSASETRNHNIPGDGKLDQSTLPSPLELMVGRIDLRNMQRAPAGNVTEVSLLRRYLTKAHDFKRKQGAYAALQRRVLIRDGFGNFSGESFMRTGWSWGFTAVGRPPEVTFDEAPSGNWWTHAATNGYLMANGNGGGSFETCGSVGATADFGRRPFRAAFVSLFGSYFGDWDSTNNFMRAPLAGNATGDGLGLTCFWAGRPTFFMHHMATGETVGYSIRQSMNSQFTSVSNPAYTPINFPGGGTHLGLVGDPSLRMHMVEPPGHLTATSFNGSVNLAWSPSAETALLGYHVYRSTSATGPFTRLTTTALASPAFADTTSNPGTAYTYLVRTLRMESSPGGTYQNLSLGSMITITANAAATGVPLNPTNLSAQQHSSVNIQLGWVDNAGNETGYRVERKDGAAGSFAPVATHPAGANAHTDSGPLNANESYYYRVIAFNAAGDSASSEVDTIETIPGFFEFDNTLLKVAKNAGTSQVAVKRFGGVHGAVTVNYATSNSSAVAGTHYTASNGTLTWADGESGEKMINVPITNTPAPQHPRQFRLTLSSPSAGTGIGTYNAVSVLIEDGAATLQSPWSQSLIGTLTDSSPAVEAEGGISSTTVGGSGLATAATSETGQFVYQTRTGDGVFTAQVAAANPAQTGARYAIMIRENATGGGALMAGTSTSSSTSEGTKLVSRATASATATFSGAVTSLTAPRWLRLTRAGSSFTSESSTDGSSWTSHGTVVVNMSSTAAWGMFHHSDDRSGTTYSGNYQMVPFQNITFAPLSGPGAPGSLAANVASPSRVTLTWTAGTLAAGYRIERRTENGAFRQLIDLPGGTLTFNDDSVGPNSAYEYRVSAYNVSGNSPVSNTARVATPPADITLLLTSGVASNADATIRGDNTSGNFGTSHTLKVAGNNPSGQFIGAAKSYLRFDLSGLPPITTAALRLTIASTSDLSTTGFTYSATLRLIPDGSDGWAEGGITWDNAPLNNLAGNGFLPGTTLLSTFTVSPLALPSVGTIITMDAGAAALDSLKGADGMVTLALNSTTQGASMDFASREHPTHADPALQVTHASPLPVRPSFLTVTEGAGSNLNLSWSDNATAETGFELQRRPAGGDFSTLITLAPDAAAHTDSATVIGTTYEYRVRTLGTGGPSAWSLVAAATAGGSTSSLPGTPSGFAGWMSQEGLVQSDSSNPLLDNDQDGVPNLVEYVQGTPANLPASASPQLSEVTHAGQHFLALTFQRKLDVTDVSLAVEVSSAISGPWTSIDPLQPENQVLVRPASPSTGWETITVRDTVPMEEAGSRFMRLSVTPR